MRLDFNVLWVEDQRDRVQAQKEKLERAVRGEGFRLQVQFVASVNEAMEMLGDDVYTDHVDLILMDYDLGPGKKGNEGLREVRGKLPYREIIFYSSQANDLLKMVAEARVEGIYCSDRTDLPDRAQGVFETLVKKVLDIDHSRGLVMGTTSDIDYFVNDCLVDAFDACDQSEQQEILGLVETRLTKARERFEESAKAVSAATHVSEILEQHAVITSADRLQLLRNVLEKKQLHKDKDGDISRYVNEMVPKRNLLGHVRVHIDGFKRRLLDRKGKEHTSGDMKALRLSLLAHHENFESLSSSLKPKEKSKP